jgi:hypothetical protein
MGKKKKFNIRIEAHLDSWENVSLVKLEVATGKLSEFSKGSFVGFGYE